MKTRRRTAPTTARAPSPRDRLARGRRVRAGLLMSRHMDFGLDGDIEELMSEEGFTLAPITLDGRPVERITDRARAGSVTLLPTAGVRDIEDGGLAALVVPGAEDPRSSEERAAFDKLVNTAVAEQVAVIALGEGVVSTMEAIGYALPDDAPPALLIHHGVRILENESDLRDAVRVFMAPSRQAA